MHHHTSTSGRQHVQNPDSSPQPRKLPLGAIVSPLNPFFNERAKVYARKPQCCPASQNVSLMFSSDFHRFLSFGPEPPTSTVEQAKAKALDTALAKLDTENTSSRTRSTSQSSKLSEACSSTSSFSSSSSLDSHPSIATPISTMGGETLPPSLPRISYEEWSKFGINLFTPTPPNPHSKMYYDYPSSPMQTNKTCFNHLTGNRPRGRSSTVHGYSAPPQDIDHLRDPNRPGNPLQNRPHPRSPLTRIMSLRHPLERNCTR